MNYIITICICLIFASCATPPAGTSTMKKELRDDLVNPVRSELSTKKTPINSGRPIYVEAWNYSQMLAGGDLWGGGRVFIFVGRETLNMKDVIDGGTK